MQVQPIRDCITEIKKQNPKTKVIYLSPQGKKLDQDLVEKLTTYDSLTMLCGRYEGIDERVIENDIDYEVSIGDYVISGGELAAMVVIDTISRRLPNVLGNEDSLRIHLLIICLITLTILDLKLSMGSQFLRCYLVEIRQK